MNTKTAQTFVGQLQTARCFAINHNKKGEKMLRQKETTKTIYSPNSGVKITVDNKPVVDEDTGLIYMYEVSFSLKLKKFNAEKPLRFRSDDELADFMAQINLDSDNNQTSMLDENGEVTVTVEAIKNA